MWENSLIETIIVINKMHTNKPGKYDKNMINSHVIINWPFVQMQTFNYYYYEHL